MPHSSSFAGMVVPQLKCNSCGLIFRSQFLSGVAGVVSLTSVSESCPRCGKPCAIPDGTFDMRRRVLQAVRAPGMTRKKVEAFRDTVEAVKAGSVTADQAVNDLAKMSESFAAILQVVGHNKHAQVMLVSILSLIVAWYALVCSNQGSEQAHEDAARAHSDVVLNQKIGAAELEVLEKIDADLQSLHALVGQQERPVQPIVMSIQAPPQRTGRPPANRQERRKAASLARRQPRP